jgi:uncharacterized membrane protein
VPQYLVEVYHSKTRPDEARLAAERVRTAAEEVTLGGVPVRCVRAHFVHQDETCLYLFEAAVAAAVQEACRRAGIAGDRIVETADLTLPAPTRPNGGSGATTHTEKGA